MNDKGESAKADTQTLILAVLRESALHGYAIAREIERRSESALTCGEGVLYPALRVLEQGGLIEGRWEVTGSGPARKVYAITEEGVADLRRQEASWRRFVAAVDRVMDGSAGRPENLAAGGKLDVQSA